VTARKARAGFKGKRSRTLFQITLLIIAVYLISGFATYFIYIGLQSRLVDKSSEKLLEMQVKSTKENSLYAADLLLYFGQNKLKTETPQSLVLAAKSGQLSEGQKFLNNSFAGLVEADFGGLRQVFLALPAEESSRDPIVVAASDTSLLCDSNLPQFLESITGGNDCFWVDQDLPQLHLEASTLVTHKLLQVPGTGLTLDYFALRPMAEEIAGNQAFLASTRKDSSLDLLWMILVSIGVMSLLTFAFLVFLIRRRITKPIDQMSSTSHEILEGKLDARMPVRKHEEFRSLKQAFNVMMSNLNSLFSIAGEEGGGRERELIRSEDAQWAGLRAKDRRPRRGWMRSGTLYYIVCFLVAIFLLATLADFLFFDHRQNVLIDKTVNRMIEQVAVDFSGVSVTVRNVVDPMVMEKLEEGSLPEITESEQVQNILNKEMNAYVDFYNNFCKDVVSKGFLGLEKIVVIMAGPLFPGGAMVVVSDDPDLVFKWSVPGYLIDAMKDGKSYVYMPDGIPELGLEGEQVIAIKTFTTMGFLHSYMGIKSMHGEVAEMRGFYGDEKNKIYLMMAPILAGSLLLLFLLTFLVLSFLLYRNITKPVEELQAAAARVMEGDLQVEVPIRKGEELEGLKNAFQEMVSSFRLLIDRSVEEE
jgi:HAMP domain-containing protein